jgi:hypothetical protein
MTGPRQSTIHQALQIAVILCAVGLLSYHWRQADLESDAQQLDLSQDSLANRNERSVPRSFILPATPGVAFEQEAQQANGDSQTRVAKCAGALRVLGYDPGESTTSLNAQLVEAVYTYQSAHNLPRTGRLDEVTMEKLKCA